MHTPDPEIHWTAQRVDPPNGSQRDRAHAGTRSAAESDAAHDHSGPPRRRLRLQLALLTRSARSWQSAAPTAMGARATPLKPQRPRDDAHGPASPLLRKCQEQHTTATPAQEAAGSRAAHAAHTHVGPPACGHPRCAHQAIRPCHGIITLLKTPSVRCGAARVHAGPVWRAGARVAGARSPLATRTCPHAQRRR